MPWLGSQHWPALTARRPRLLVPLGSTEQHGPHLPLDTDTRIAVAVALRAAELAIGDGLDVLVAPPVPLGASGEHAGFPGTLSIGTEALVLVLVELVRSADWAAGCVFVNGHGGNVEGVNQAVERLRDEGRSVRSWWPRHTGTADGDLHAGHLETSVLLALDARLVDLAAATAGPRPGPSHEELRQYGVQPLSPSGVLGDPSGASADEGTRALDDWAEDLRRYLHH